MGANLFFAGAVMQVADVDLPEGQAGLVRGSGVGACGEQHQGVLLWLLLLLSPQNSRCFGQIAADESDRAWYGQTHDFLPQFVRGQVVIGHDQDLGPDVGQPSLNDLSMNESVVDAEPKHFRPR